MSQNNLIADQINALTSFSVGTLDEKDAMMVLDIAVTQADLQTGVRCQVPLVMTPAMARNLAHGLMIAADSVKMGQSPTYAWN